jgi:asparagine synthase (glutamine-hydrolysing)
MCGVAAVLKRHERITEDESLGMDRLLDVMAYRGPDSSQAWCRGRVLLGHRRLSIIDLSDAGQQPFHDEESGLHIVFNGEIYNYRELRRQLADRHVFKSDTDTEVILAAYERFGDDFLRRLRGMFAFVLVDDRRGRVVMARDPLGKKPLYYAMDDDRLLVASEIKALHAFGGDLSLDPESVAAFFTLQYIPGPFTIYRGVQRLMPGEMLTLELERWRVEKSRYWSLTSLPERHPRDVLESIHAALEESVRYRLVADVEVGVLLSGGIDSTLVSWYAQRLSERPLRAFSVAFGSEDLDESPYARAVAAELGMAIVVESGDEVDQQTFERVVFHADEPLGDPACIPTFGIAKALSHHVRVVLSGEGADELFWGYPHYRRHQRWSWLPSLQTRNGLLSLFAGALEQHPLIPGPIARLEKAVSCPPALGSARWTCVFGPHSLRGLVGEELGGGSRTPRFVAQFAEWQAQRSRASDDPAAPGTLDLAFWLPDDLLLKVDRMTMAHSVEARAPFLDHHLVELAVGLPEALKSGGRETKRLLRQLVRDRLPPRVVELVAGRKKHGFEVPIVRWMKTDLRSLAEEAFSRENVAASGILDVGRTVRLWRRFAHARHVERGYARKIWLLLCFLEWHRQHLGHFGFRRAPAGRA